MRIASRLGRSVIVEANLCLDIETASEGTFGHRIDNLYPDWQDFADWAAEWPRRRSTI